MKHSTKFCKFPTLLQDEHLKNNICMYATCPNHLVKYDLLLLFPLAAVRKEWEGPKLIAANYFKNTFLLSIRWLFFRAYWRKYCLPWSCLPLDWKYTTVSPLPRGPKMIWKDFFKKDWTKSEKKIEVSSFTFLCLAPKCKNSTFLNIR